MAETKVCKYCQMEIPRKAAICPYCRKRLEAGPLALGCLIIILFFIGIIFVGIMGSHESSTPSTGTQAPNPDDYVTLTKAGKKIKDKHPDWDKDTCNTVAEHKVQIGMTTDQVRAAWGRPYRVNTTNLGTHIHEQWVMHEYGSTYLYFEDGVLTSTQTSH